jgi:signal transduction histidine kinase
MANSTPQAHNGPSQTSEQEAIEAKNNAKTAELDASEAISKAEVAKSFAEDAICKIDNASQSSEMASQQGSEHSKDSLTEAGLAMSEAKAAIQIAESARGEAESARNQAEEARHTAEGARNLAEEARTLAEKNRGSEETERIKAERSKQKAERAKEEALALANALEEKQTELMQYATTLKINNKDLEQFALLASHDLQAPLRKIKLFSEHIEKEAKGKLSPESLDGLQRIQKSIHSMQNLIKDQLSVARTPQIKQFELVDLATVVKDVLANLDTEVKEKQAVIEVREMVTMVGDETQLHQLLQNLIENALKFQLKDNTPVIRITSTLLDEQGCQITVSDNGIGFAQEDEERIFETFVRLHGADSFPGTGVGLANCKQIAERHGGSISAKSAPGEGAVFIVTLPF